MASSWLMAALLLRCRICGAFSYSCRFFSLAAATYSAATLPRNPNLPRCSFRTVLRRAMVEGRLLASALPFGELPSAEVLDISVCILSKLSNDVSLLISDKDLRPTALMSSVFSASIAARITLASSTAGTRATSEIAALWTPATLTEKASIAYDRPAGSSTKAPTSSHALVTGKYARAATSSPPCKVGSLPGMTSSSSEISLNTTITSLTGSWSMANRSPIDWNLGACAGFTRISKPLVSFLS
mmetsp:Transcript_33797/g.77141  ORF Transcript_33797/g.77141 Transcript_33797/m.77141 type:complete len:243 (-) Transcript_33797:641-1369(-)